METAPACPRCRSALSLGQAPDVELLLCGGCSGVWLDNRACQLLVGGELSEAAHVLIRHVDAAAGEAPARPGDGEAGACPSCGGELRAHVTDEGRQGVCVRLDVCPSHGAWFDRGEAWTLLQAVLLKRLALDVELQADALDRRWDARERAWAGFVAGAAGSSLRRAR